MKTPKHIRKHSSGMFESAPSAHVIGRAVFDFEGDDYDQLSFQVGDLITIIEQDPSGWWTGEIKGRVGMFPYNYVEIEPEEPVTVSKVLKSPGAGKTQFTPLEDDAIDAEAGNGENIVHDDDAKLPEETEMKIPRQMSSRDYVKAALTLPKKPVYGKTRIGPWGSNMAKSGGVMCVVLGLASILWVATEHTLLKVYNGLGVYSILLGFGIRYFESRWGRKPSSGKRSAMYIILSIPLWFAWTTVMAAAILCLSSIVHAAATFAKESYERPRNVIFKWKTLVYGRGDDAEQNLGVVGNLRRWFLRKHEQHQLGYVLVILGYFGLCTGLVFRGYNTKSRYFKETGDDVATWGSIARGTARLLGLNSCFLLFPVSQSLIRGLFNRAHQDRSRISQILFSINKILPFPTALELHILMARTTVVVSIIHTFIHFINYATTPDGVFSSFPFITGSLIFLTMLFIYSASDPYVRRGHLRLFWTTHYLFPLFYLFMMIHSKLSEEFVIFFMVPGLTYLFEKIYRWRSKIKSVKLCSVTSMRNSVFVIEFLKSDVFGPSFSYREGQYLLVNCPAIDQDQWVPVTVSSAPGQENVTLHIRSQGDESWTTQLQRYLLTFDMTNLDQNEFGSYGIVQDTVNHKSIIKVDGPHAGPTQYVTNHNKMMVIGTGIGVTALVSTLNSIVHFLWRTGDVQKLPKHVYFYCVLKHKDIKSFRYLITQVKEACDGIADLRAGHADQMLDRVFEFHFFTTSIPESFEEASLPEITDWSFWGRGIRERMGESFPIFGKLADFTHQELYKLVEKPEIKPKKLGDVYVHRGRPEWSEVFSKVQRQYPANADIGVSFCGNPELLEEIDHCCTIYSSPADNRVFTLHSQKFD
eukprot:TRINITY_DN7806_c0_g1_i1.p1 TRINITY_DN7806_c0_g1~~TRINITY_DN7806_c0_g1_i1.p1  ORF type:complete len:867 (-),score=162.65 TRINITY_DN7806_c0_g1_i1:55-2655(-)